MRRSFKWVALMVAICGLGLIAPSSGRGSANPSEAEVKAVYLFHFAEVADGGSP